MIFLGVVGCCGEVFLVLGVFLFRFIVVFGGDMEVIMVVINLCERERKDVF